MRKSSLAIIFLLLVIASLVLLVSCYKTEGPNGETDSSNERNENMNDTPDSVPLSSYRIVCDKGDKDARAMAKHLISVLKEQYETTLPFAYMSETTEDMPEIVVGNGTREICECLTDLGLCEYTVRANGRDLLLAGNTDRGTSAAIERFLAILARDSSDEIRIPTDLSVTEPCVEFAEVRGRTEGADIRVMSFNLLCELWDDTAKATFPDRTELCTMIIDTFRSDVIGVQEVSDKWQERIDKLLGNRYAFTDRETPEGETNFSTLLYNPDTVILHDHGVRVYSEGNDRRLRLVSWGVFESIADGKQFIVMSTHWDLSQNSEYQMIHAEEMGEEATRLIAEYDLPVITTGDYNRNDPTQAIQTFVSITGFSEAKHTADTIEKACKTHHTLGKQPSPEPADSIDHIFGSGEVHFLYYNVLTDELVCRASDHCPIYADIQLPETGGKAE